MPQRRSTTPPKSEEPTSDAYYRSLLDQSTAARQRGDHSQAQQFASAAHKWTMEEKVRRQRLAHAEAELQQARKQLQTAWDKDRSCTTLAELGERHPEVLRLIARCQAAEEQVVFFSTAQQQAVSPPSPAAARRRRPDNG